MCIKRSNRNNWVPELIGLDTMLESAKIVLREAYLVHRIARSSASASSDPMSGVCSKHHAGPLLVASGKMREMKSELRQKKKEEFFFGVFLMQLYVLIFNLDGAPIASKSHTQPSHSQTSRLLSSSLSLGVPVPRPTQCVRGA